MREKLVAQYTEQAGEKIAQATQKKPLSQTLLNLIPQNPLEEAVNAFNPEKANGRLIAVMVFSLFFGIAMTVTGEETAAPLKELLDAVFRVCLKIIDFALMKSAVSRPGSEVAPARRFSSAPGDEARSSQGP